MRERIHTIPLVDALREPGLCVFCAISEKLEQSAVLFILGPAYMEDGVRMDTNKTGFCRRHMEAMYSRQNKLGLALMLHTHLQQMNKDIRKLASSGPLSLFGQGADSGLGKLSAHLSDTYEN